MRFDRFNLARLLTALIVFVSQAACACHAMAAPVQAKSHACCHKDHKPRSHRDGACPHCDGSAAAVLKADQSSEHFASLDFPSIPFFAAIAPPTGTEHSAFAGAFENLNFPPPATLLALHCALIT